jgi:DNA-binding response OmpR family regulator
MKENTTLTVVGEEPALFDVLQEYAANSVVPLRVVKGTAEPAAIQLLCVNDKSALEAQMRQARSARKNTTQTTQLLILSGDLEEPEEEAAELGFAGIFRKPLRLAALLDAGFSHLRMAALKSPRKLSPNVVFNPFTRTLEDKAGGRSEILTPKEADFLLALMEAGEAGLSREAALTRIWGYHREVDSHAVETALWRLRRKLESLFGADKVLESRDGAYFLKV